MNAPRTTGPLQMLVDATQADHCRRPPPPPTDPTALTPLWSRIELSTMANSQRICVLSKLVHASERQVCLVAAASGSRSEQPPPLRSTPLSAALAPPNSGAAW